MTLQELRKSGRDGVYDPVTDQYYFVGEEPAAQAQVQLAAKPAKLDHKKAVAVDEKKTGAVQDVKPSQKTDEKERK